MSIPTNANGASIIITLNAASAEELAEQIQRKLEMARKAQEERPTMCWFEPAKDADNETWIRYYAVTGTITVCPGIELQIFPDKRHPGCSGYCHY